MTTQKRIVSTKLMSYLAWDNDDVDGVDDDDNDDDNMTAMTMMI